MRRYILMGIASLTLATAWAGAPAAPEQAVNQLTAEEQAEGYELLFNGQNLDSWVLMGKPEGWKVQDGVIHSDGGKEGNWLRLKWPYRDFILRLQWKVSPGGNSGMFIRCAEEGAPWETGHEIQISNEQPPRDDLHCTGSLYGTVAVNPRPDESPDVWHEFEIRAVGKRITVRCDGKPCVDANGDEVEAIQDKPLKGFIGLQDSHTGEGGVIEYRNLRLKDLSSRRPDNTPPEGFTALFNGKDLTGWKGLVADPPKRAQMSPEDLAQAQEAADQRMREHWKVEDGALVFDGKGDSLCTAKDYGDFELWVDWKILPAGDSGIYLRGSPQVQIWENPVGSGGLYNNQKNPSQPRVVADRPIGQWNTFRILMRGEKVAVYLNDVLIVDNVTMENYWERDKPIYPTGQIELQNHGNTLYFKNIYIKELKE
jgi:hypothetical protein